jgi:serine/threonine-protein kinase RsbW
MDKCQYSRLTVPNDPSYAEAAAVYAYEVAKLMGFQEKDLKDVRTGVANAIIHIIEQAFDPGQRASLEISCERVPMGLKIIIKDQGLPFGPADALFREANISPRSEATGATLEQSDLWDEVSFHNLGHEGKETHFIKYLQNPAHDYHEVCEIPFASHEESTRVRSPEPVPFQVRPMLPSEAVDVARCFYRAYGYSFVFRQIYYPDRIVELNETGRISSVVAVTDRGEVIGHCAMVRWNGDRNAAELGFAVVKPEYRGQGCLYRLTEYLVNKAKSDGLQALHVLAATNHTHSQRVAHKFGLNPSGLLVGLAPATVSFKGLTTTLAQRESYLVCFRFLQEPKILPLFVPERHKAFVTELYRNLGVEPRFAVPAGDESEFAQAHSRVNTTYFTPSGFGFIEIEEFGSDIVSEVRAAVRDLCVKGIEAIELYCDMTNPLTYSLAEQFEELGFFIGGIKPLSSRGEALILQYLNNISMDYTLIKTASEQGERIRSHIRACDPNQTAGGDV